MDVFNSKLAEGVGYFKLFMVCKEAKVLKNKITSQIIIDLLFFIFTLCSFLLCRSIFLISIKMINISIYWNYIIEIYSDKLKPKKLISEVVYRERLV